MVGKHLRVDAIPQAPQQRRRALNVGKQKREGLHKHSVEGPAKPTAADSQRTGAAPTPTARPGTHWLADHQHRPVPALRLQSAERGIRAGPMTT
jgi:hypothetical protein